jgi:hypothetical protein
MATYKEIKGVTVQTRDEDPVQNAGTWAAGGDLNTARTTSGAGKQTANLAFGGDVPGGRTNICESYDGTSWTEVGDMNTSRSTHGGMGTYTAALAAGGRVSPSASTAVSEEWDGSSWTEGNDLNQNRYAINNRGAGTQTAGLCVGGNRRLTPQGTTSPNLAPQNFFSGTEEYDGTSWTEVNDAPLGGESGGGLGTQTAAGMWGIYNGSLPSPSTRANGYLYDGTNWTTTTDFPIEGGAYSESGTTTDGLAFGIYNNSTPGAVANTVAWNGTVWTEVNDISTARYGAGGGKAGADPSQVAILAGGYSTTQVANTEEWSFPPVTQDKLKEGMLFLSGGTTLKGFGKAGGIPSATWASGGNLNEGREYGMGFGIQTAAIIAGGDGNPLTVNTESYNGSSFTEVNNLNTARRAGMSAGLQTAGLVFGGQTPSLTGVTESWDGTNFTEVADMNTARTQGANGKIGTQTDAMYTGGEVPGGESGATEIWDGTSWTEVADLNDPRKTFAGAGTSTPTAIVFGGDTPPNTANTETWNGTAWTEVNNLNTARRGLGGAGNKTQALCFAGSEPSSSAKNEFWNGSSWTEVNDLSTATDAVTGLGTGISALSTGGTAGGGYSASTEEFTADNALATVTVS